MTIMIEEKALIIGKRPSDIVVHHLNKDTRDNNPENLEIMSRPAHCKIHDINNHAYNKGYREGYNKASRIVAEEIFREIEEPDPLVEEPETMDILEISSKKMQELKARYLKGVK